MAASLLMLLLACSGGGDDTGTAGSTTDGGSTDTDTGTTTATDVCADLGLTSRPWQDVDESKALYATASDITLHTVDGEVMLSTLWTGCETFLFIQDSPSQATGWPRDLWERDVDDLFDALPPNTHIFFSSDGTSTSAIEESLAVIQEEVEDALDDMDAEDALWWTQRVHYLERRSQISDGWLGDLHNNPGWGVGIDRFQRIRYIGSYADPNRYSSDYGWFEPNISKAANEARFYNFESDRADLMDAEDATTLNVYDGDRVAGSTDVEVTLPDLASYDTVSIDLYMGCEGDGEYGYCPAWDYMAYVYMCDRETEDNAYTDMTCQPAVDAVAGLCEVDGETTKTSCSTDDDCTWTEGGEAGDTGDTGDTGTAGVEIVGTCVGYEAAIAADTIEGDCEEPTGGTDTELYTCNEDGSGYGDLACSCDTEIGRWITTYHREGRWVHDISPMLPLLDTGGTWRFRFSTSGPYELDMDLRFSNQGKAARPQEVVYAFSGGTINPDYNSNYEPFAFTPPTGTTSVQLATVISQHGADGNNCGEFCDIAHHFTVNGDEASEIVRDFPEASTIDDCEDDVANGTVPNQYGTWWYGRAGWCPGREVQTVVHDITDQVNVGEENELSYRALYNGADYTGSATIRMRSWIVYGW